MTAPVMARVLRSTDPRSSSDAGDSGSVTASRAAGARSSRFPTNVYSDALGCSH